MPENTAVAVVEQSPDAIVEWSLDNWPEAEWNRLVPTQTLGLGTDLIRPIVQAVRLDIETDTYKSNDIPEGFRAPNAKGLAKLAAAAGVDFTDEVRLDDGSNPNRAYVRIYAEMIDGTGRKRRAPGSRDYILESQQMTDAQRRRAKAFVHENAATRAKHRALRALLALPQAFTIAQLQKPFAVVSFIPNLQHPELRSRVLDAMVPTIAALYGPTQAKQLEAGPVEVPEIGPDAPPKDVTPSDEPDWMQGSAPAKAAAKPDFVIATRAFATEGEDADELATAEDKDKLRAIFAGWEARVVGAGIRALWPDQEPNALSKGQARAIARVQESLGHDDFERAWKRIAEQQTASAAA